jgi:hypothetical protein
VKYKFNRAGGHPLQYVQSERSSRRAGGLRKSPGRGRRQLTIIFKTEIRNTKHETNSNDKNTNDKNLNPLRHQTLQCGLIRFYYQDLFLCSPRFKHLNIRILYLFRISIFEFRIFHGFAFSPRVGRTFPSPPLEVVF